MKHLFLADLEKLSEEEIKQHIIDEYEATSESIDPLEVLIAYESVGGWGCDSSSFFLFRHKETGDLFEVHGSHCSCFGFEGQFDLEPTTVEYLKSDKFSFATGGYDYSEDNNKALVKEYIKDNL